MTSGNKLLLLPFLILLFFLHSCKSTGPKKNQQLPEGFVYVHEAVPEVVYDIRYFTTDNFVGKPVNGYKKAVAIISTEAAEALKKVQLEAKSKGLALKVFDAYRPQKAVDHFVAWGKDEFDTLTKAKYYPNIDKATVFEKGYVATKSGHTRGSTIDLTLVYAHNNEELDMGAPWDFFGLISHHDSPLVMEEQTFNRNLLKEMMEKHGFVPYDSEWWHYTLQNEPYPDTYFDFDVE